MLKTKCMSFPSLPSSLLHINFPETVFVLMRKTVPKKVEIHYLIRAVQAAKTTPHITSGKIT